jgi:hypothetical protein
MAVARFFSIVLLLVFPLLSRAASSEQGGEPTGPVVIDWCARVDAIIMTKKSEPEMIAALAECVQIGDDIKKVHARLRGARCIASGPLGTDEHCEDFDCRLRICSKNGRVVQIEYFPLSGGHRHLIGEW